MGDIGSVMTDRTIPAVGSSGTAYATSITAFLTEVRQRLEDSIPLSSLEMSALDMANNEITNVNYLRLYEQDDAPTTPVGSLQRFGNNLYWISASGAVQLTDGADINVAGTGGITGDYGAGPEQFRYVDADSTFYAYADYAGGEWARVWARSFDVAGDATGTERIRITWAGTGSSYTLTLPAAVPAAPALLQMDASGNVTASNTLTEDIIADDFRHTDAHGITYGPASFLDVQNDHLLTFAGSLAPAHWAIQNSIEPLVLPLALKEGDVLTSYTVYWNKASVATDTLKSQIWASRMFTSVTEVAQTVLSQTSVASPGLTTTGTSSLSITIQSGWSYYLVCTAGVVAGGDALLGATIAYTRP
jgi:hypothetical protein